MSILLKGLVVRPHSTTQPDFAVKSAGVSQARPRYGRTRVQTISWPIGNHPLLCKSQWLPKKDSQTSPPRATNENVQLSFIVTQAELLLIRSENVESQNLNINRG